MVSIPQPTEGSLSSPEILLTKFEALALSDKAVRYYITRAALGQTVLSCLHENSTGGPTKSNSLAVVTSPTTLLLIGLQIALFPPVITSDVCMHLEEKALHPAALCLFSAAAPSTSS